jgi:hypothetical protein
MAASYTNQVAGMAASYTNQVAGMAASYTNQVAGMAASYRSSGGPPRKVRLARWPRPVRIS